MKQTKTILIIDNIEDTVDKSNNDKAIVDFSIMKENKIVLRFSFEFDYYDDDSTQYYKDMKKLLKEIGEEL